MFQDRHSVRAGKVAANLNLQMMLYYHAMFDLLWITTNWSLHEHKVLVLPAIYPYEIYLNYLLYLVFCLAEFPRLYLGYRGNLQEQVHSARDGIICLIFCHSEPHNSAVPVPPQVPAMSAFFMLTLFPLVPIMLYFAFLERHLLPFNRITSVIQFVWVVAEVWIGLDTCNALIARRTAKFYHE
jgi:hypothetical protein